MREKKTGVSCLDESAAAPAGCHGIHVQKATLLMAGESGVRESGLTRPGRWARPSARAIDCEMIRSANPRGARARSRPRRRRVRMRAARARRVPAPPPTRKATRGLAHQGTLPVPRSRHLRPRAAGPCRRLFSRAWRSVPRPLARSGERLALAPPPPSSRSSAVARRPRPLTPATAHGAAGRCRRLPHTTLAAAWPWRRLD